MERIRDYTGFVVWFAGLGYVAIWPLSAGGYTILPPSLNIVGLIAAVLVTARIGWWGLRARRQDLDEVPPHSPLHERRRRPRPNVKPRSHFGLRGMPR
jgi:hypothetical protein